MRDSIDAFFQSGFWGIADVLIVASLFYFVLVWFKKTKAAFVAFGMIILAAIYVFARSLHLVMTAYIFQGFFAVFLIALVVIFQEELRQFFERIAVWSLGGMHSSPLGSLEIEELVRTLGDLARQKRGALIILKGRDPIERHVTGGVELDGKISEELLKSIFDPHSEGHDGAMVVDRNRVELFGAHLPLSKDLDRTAKMGTRHAAALGLSELTDALCLVVSEERGRISIAHEGALVGVDDLQRLQTRIDEFLHETRPEAVQTSDRWTALFKINIREKLAAVGLSMALWFLVVEGSQVARRQFEVTVVPQGVREELILEWVRPRKVEAMLTGLRRDLYFLDPGNLRLRLDVSRLAAGEADVPITLDMLHVPDELRLLRIEPASVKLSLRQRAPPP